MQSTKCEKLFKEIRETLDDENKKKLLLLVDEYFALNGLSDEESYEQGFKTAIRLMAEALT